MGRGEQGGTGGAEGRECCREGGAAGGTDGGEGRLLVYRAVAVRGGDEGAKPEGASCYRCCWVELYESGRASASCKSTAQSN